jgi:3-oxoacyl-[acyl-carrier-protein] synthase-1/3-oxoacyl-[acyl-carrier-protein] synthase II
LTVAIVAWAASSPLGEGPNAVAVPGLGEAAPSAVGRDAELAAAGLARPFAGRVAAAESAGRDRATVLLERALDGVARALDEAMPDWRRRRVGAAIGTSSGGMRSFEDPRAPAAAGTYLAPVLAAARPCAFAPFSLVLGACASGALAIGLGRAWLLEDRCDLVLAGGFDAVSVFVAAGFESLRATAGAAGPRPFRVGRDGLSLGEGAAIVALTRPDDGRRAARAWVNGFGASCDAHHLTAPDPDGAGLLRAAASALDDAGVTPTELALVSAHATATAQNDAAEARAIAALGTDAPVFAFKGAIGHTLGAAGALELLAAVEAMRRGLAPASAGTGPILPDVRIADRSTPGRSGPLLKLSAAFGGANAALVASLVEPPARGRTGLPVYVGPAAFVGLADAAAESLAARTGAAVDRLARADDLVRLTIAAAARLLPGDRGGPEGGAGIVVGHGLATLEANAVFQGRIRQRGAARAAPRQFPYTTPNAAAGECAALFGLRGPALAVGGGPHGGLEALAVAADLVRSGIAPRIVVVAVDAAGPATARVSPETASGAVALVVAAEPGPGWRRLEEAEVRLERDHAPCLADAPLPASMAAHGALRALVSRAAGPLEVMSAPAWPVRARVRLGPVPA